ncbi:MAG: sigma-70 family RNA polymerase sigma factor [Myxococcales bacterium]|nr:sigma-70 family RNA polymerase sigma factor [Myxococcales bacterium]
MRKSMLMFASAAKIRRNRRLSISDAELLRRVARRDQRAAGEFFDRYAAEISAFLRMRLNEDESEEMLQEVFARALRGASRFRGQSEVRTWLRSIARYTLSEHFRGPTPPQSLPDSLAYGPGPESIAIHRERVGAMVSALERLPDDQAIVVGLSRVEGLSHEEIARKLNIKPATSRKRFERAIKALSRSMQSRAAPPPRHTRFESWCDSLFRRAIPRRPSHEEPSDADSPVGHP